MALPFGPLPSGGAHHAGVEGRRPRRAQAHSRHKSDRAFREYVRPEKLMENTPSAELGL